MKVSFVITKNFPVSPEELYHAWLDSEKHSDMTGGEAVCSQKVDGEFSAWDGYISGKNKSLIPERQIIQEWKTTDFDLRDKPSLITIDLEESKEGCLLTLTHEDIPRGQPDYEAGWIEHYFNPMLEYFSNYK